MKKIKFIPVLIVVLFTGLFFNQVAFADDTEEVIPFGINNPFRHPDSDEGSGECLQTNSALTLGHNSSGQVSYAERHIEANAIKRCIPNGVGYMENIKKIGVNLISQHFSRRYCEEDCNTKEDKKLPYFGLEEWKHRNHEIPVQLYINGFNNYFWAAINPQSTKYFPGDITIIDEERHSYLPNSPEGFAEWQSWLSAMFDYLDAHNATDKLSYIQLGNESDGDYRKKKGADPKNKDDYYWLAYAKLIENSYKIIRERAPKAKIVIGTIGAGGVTIEGFQRPVLEYLSGKIDEDGKIVNREKRCGGAGCFDVYDYHDFSGYKEYREWEVCRPRGCILKSPGYFRALLDSSDFSDKGLVVQQGGTYTGQDNKINKEYQTEEDQAAYLVKRGIYLLSQGVEATQSVTYIENFGYQDDGIHNWFTLMGLTYNGTPEKGKVPPYFPYINVPTQEMINRFGNDCSKYQPQYQPWCEYNNNKDTCDGQLPCPEPGKDVKKLSWFSYKKLIEILKGSDWSNVKIIYQDADNGIYAFKFIKDNQPVYVAWWDWWKGYPRKESEVERCKATYEGDYTAMDKCVNDLDGVRMSKNITLNFAQARKIKITETVPDYATGQEVDTVGYEGAFSSYTKDVIGGEVELNLGKKPLYIEEIPDKPPVACVVNPGQTVQARDTVYLDGSCSFDPDHDPLTYQWTQTSGELVDLQNSNTATSSFIAPSIVALKNRNFSFTATLVSSVSVVIEFFKSIFVDGTGTGDNNDLGFQLIVTANDKTSNAPAKVSVIPSFSISIVSPPDGTVFSPNSKTEIKAKAKGENIRSVYFLINSQKYKGRYDKQEDAYFFNWDIPDGYSKPYNIKAQLVAYPVKKGETTVESKPITVYSASAPSIFIINPQNGQIVKAKQRITVEAKFNPNDAGITKVGFFIIENNGKIRKQIDSNPNKAGVYSFLWTVPNTPGTSYQIQVLSYTKDLSGRQTPASQSEMIGVRVE